MLNSSPSQSTGHHFNARDITGQRFGALTVVERWGQRYQPSGQKKTIWKCVCDCGKEHCVDAANLRNGSTRSCGCIRGKLMVQSKGTHGLSKHKLNNVWNAMIQRCKNPEVRQFKDYGGRGIAVCERWTSFENFFADMGESWREGLSIERDDVNGDYCPENCRWIPMGRQARNTRRNVYVTVSGTTRLLCDWAKLGGNKGSVIANRLKRGVHPELAVFHKGRIETKLLLK